MKLDYNDRHRHYPPDTMHTITDVVQTLIEWITGQVKQEKHIICRE